MSPAYVSLLRLVGRQSAGPILEDANSKPTGNWRAAAQDHPEDLILESWSEGFVVGSLIIMACITIANMRRKVLLHKLILLELVLAMTHGTFCFMDFKGYGWYLSATAMMLYISWIIHNVVAWMKVKPFFARSGGFFRAEVGIWVQRIYWYSLALTIPVIVFQIQDNYRFFNNLGGWYTKVRPYEPLFRDPWWAFTCLALFHVIRKCYGTGVMSLIKRSPRLGILLAAIVLSLVFTIADIVASITPFVGSIEGINPFWKLSLVFKCLTDTIMLDDFKTELKRLGIKRMEKEEARRNSVALVREYPSTLDGDSEAHTHARHDTVYHFKRHRLQNKTTNKYANQDPRFKDSRDFNEDPLSEYTAQRESQSQFEEKKHRGTNSADAEQDQVEFATALHLDPSQVSGVRSTRHSVEEEVLKGRSTPPPRDHVRTTTKKLGKLPGLNHLRFEAIKPGKKSRQRYNDAHDTDDEEEETFHTRNLAEEINRNTIMDLEAQKEEVKKKKDKNKNKNKVSRSKSETKEGNETIQEEDESKSESESESDSDRERREDLERLRRFRASIGAAE